MTSSEFRTPHSELPAGEPPEPIAAPTPARLFSGLRLVSLLTLLSRLFGLVRDMAMATLFGNGPVMDAFTVAFRVPNLARQLFGEGALSAAFLPVFIRETEQNGRESAWQLASALLSALVVTLGVVVLLAELALWTISSTWTFGQEAQLLLGLTAALLPYLVFICLAAQMSAVLNSMGRFMLPALLPVLLNVLWLAAVLWVAPRFESSVSQIFAIAACIVTAGIVQMSAPFLALRRIGFHFQAGWRSSAPKLREISSSMLPILIGLSITQCNTLLDSLIAWGFSQPVDGSKIMDLPGNIEYPLTQGTASALYLGQRLYQFPLGVFGVALGTVLFPLLSRHAQRGRLDLLRGDLTLGLRLVVCFGLPASAGLIVLAEPLTALLFQRGAFDAEDARQTAGAIAGYACGVWAYCGLLIVHRGYYAFGDRITPMRVGLATLVINFILNLVLIWPLGGVGLALATAIASSIQVVTVTLLVQAKIGSLDWRALGRTILRTAIATTSMVAAAWLTMQQLPVGERLREKLLLLVVPLLVAVAVFLIAARLLGMEELQALFRRDFAGRQESKDKSRETED